MSKSSIVERLLNPGVIAIIRAHSSQHLIDATQALIDGGVSCIEVTLTTPDALEVIRTASQKFGNHLLMGAGSVLDAAIVRLATLAAAQFVVTPTTNTEVIQACHRYGIPIVCGAYTPTEAQSAYEAGADLIKIFPADALGPSYIKAIKAPLPHLELIPTGGVDLKNCGEFIKAGAVAVAVGGSLVSEDILEAQDWKRLSEMARAMVAAVKAAKSTC